MSTVPMSLRIDSKLKLALEREAELEDRSLGYMAQRAISHFVAGREEMRKMIDDAFAEADKGVFVSEEAVYSWMASWGTDNELPMPEPDIFPIDNGK
jgi:predicted transcriptional regulator